MPGKDRSPAQELFSLVHRFDDKSRLQTWLLGEREHSFRADFEQFAIRPSGTYTFLIGTGTQIGQQFDHLIEPMREHVLVYPMIFLRSERSYRRWATHFKEIRRLCIQFLMAARDAPCAMWSYDLCLTDGLVIKHHVAARQASIRFTDYPRYYMREPVPIKYPRAGMGTTVRGADLCWAIPNEIERKDVGLVKIVRRETYNVGQERASIYRERLGVTWPEANEEFWLPRGLHPNLAGLVYSAFRGDHGPASLVEFGEAGVLQTSGLLDNSGVLDVRLFKLTRLFLDDFPDPLYDELTFALSRELGEVVYINASSGRLLDSGEHAFQHGDFGWWLKRSR